MTVRGAGSVLTQLEDEALVARSQQGDQAALIVLLERHRRYARAKARSYFLVGADADDLEQEGLIGLYKAARDFRDDRQSSFRAFAELCISRQVITAIKAATRQKHQPLNRYISLSGIRGADDEAEYRVEALLDDHWVADPADTVVWHETLQGLRVTVAQALSSLEADVLHRYLSGKSYQEIAQDLGRHSKSIDNALQRIKRKLDQHLANPDTVVAA